MGDDEFLWSGWGVVGINGNDLGLGPNKSEKLMPKCPQKEKNNNAI